MSSNYSKENEKDEENSKNNNIKENIVNENVTETSSIRTKHVNPKNNTKLIIIIICILVTVFIIMIAVLMNKLFKNHNSYHEEKANEKIELKYTETSDTSVDGVYITDVSDVVENVMPSIVSITSKTLITSGNFGPNYFGRQQYTEGAGSGIIISKSDTDILILTNNHVVNDASELSVKFINGKSFDAKIVGISERKDIAVISVSLSDIDSDTLKSIKIATMGDSDELKVGTGIIAIGNALGYGQSVTTGVVSALDREVSIDNYTNKMIQIDAAVNGGNSGGALLNSKGEVVGINSAKYSSNGSSYSTSIEGMGFAIPISDVKDLITKLMNGEEDTSVTIGIEGYVIDEQYSSNYNVPTGFYISKILSGSGADKSELEIGNIITKINGNNVTKLSDIQNVLYELNKGDSVTLTVSYASDREYREKEVQVTLS